MKKIKSYEVSIQLTDVCINVNANSISEARNKALEKLNEKPASKYIDWVYDDCRKIKRIDVECKD